MPELPEVETSRRLLERHLEGETISRVAVADDRIVFDGVAPRTFARKIRGRRVESVRRKGKYLWFELDRRPWPAFHFGMGGRFHVYGETGDRPRFWKVEMVTTQGLRLAMTNARRLGRIRLSENPPQEPPISLLGFDYLSQPPSLAQTRELLARRKAPIKALLLNQTCFAGVGNWVADEVLYQAGVDPRRPADRLGAQEVKRLHARLRSVIRKAVEVEADSDRFPSAWLFHHRWGKQQGSATTRGKIRFDTVGGRTTAWVPKVQK